MGMSTHVIGIKPPDEKWQRMRAVWETCAAAGVPVPAEVNKFFGYEKPDPRGVLIEIEKTDAVKKYNADGQQGFEIVVSKLPPDVTVVRVYNSW